MEIHSQVILRNAVIDDAKYYFGLVNDPIVRLNSMNSAPILWENHVNWFCNKLANENSLLYVLELDNKFIGQIRFEKILELWVIDYSIISEMRGKGIGKILVDMGMKELLSTHESIELQAFVKESNVASRFVFEKLNFELRKTDSSGYYYNKTLENVKS